VLVCADNVPCPREEEHRSSNGRSLGKELERMKMWILIGMAYVIEQSRVGRENSWQREDYADEERPAYTIHVCRTEQYISIPRGVPKKSVQSENAITHIEWTGLEHHFRMLREHPSACDRNNV
jgi:hypothetical protein